MEALATPGLPRFFRFLENSSQTVVRGWAEREKSLGERGADFGEWKAQTLGFVPLIGHPCDLRKELLFFFVCTGPSDILLLTELEEDFVEPFFLRVMAAIPGGIGRKTLVSRFHCISHPYLERVSSTKLLRVSAGVLVCKNKNQESLFFPNRFFALYTRAS